MKSLLTASISSGQPGQVDVDREAKRRVERLEEVVEVVGHRDTWREAAQDALPVVGGKLRPAMRARKTSTPRWRSSSSRRSALPWW